MVAQSMLTLAEPWHTLIHSTMARHYSDFVKYEHHLMLLLLLFDLVLMYLEFEVLQLLLIKLSLVAVDNRLVEYYEDIC